MTSEYYSIADTVLAWIAFSIVCVIFYTLCWQGIERYILVPFAKKKLYDETAEKDKTTNGSNNKNL